uniref:Branched-chain-amino-acid aminotransferase n=2 Tax=Ornithorhynchus anatinus TaxID=9258 RepID=F6U261_ORNAN
MATGLRYAGRVAVVTGGSRGIGEGIVRAFVDQGARVVFCDKDEAAGQALELALREANTPGEAVFVLCDVTREEELQTLFSETLRRFGRLDCLVNNAGRHPGPERIEETTAQEFRDLLELNLLGYYTASKLALPYLRQTQGNIINISSLVAIIGQREAVPYVATKILARKLHKTPLLLCGPRRCVSSTFKAADLHVELSRTPRPKPPAGAQLTFGKTFTDHMLTVEWSEARGWGRPHIRPFQNLSVHPACSALHYAIQLFEGMKAYRGPDRHVRLFRPMLNMDRMLRSALRLCLPSFDKAELLECIRRLVEVDQDWVPESNGSSLYIRPTFVGNEPSLGVARAHHALLFVIQGPVGPYFPGDGFSPVSLLADPRFVRAWLGGVGDCKLGGNYGPTVFVQQAALKEGCEQALWLYGEDHQLTEVGTMNIFLFWTNDDGELELVTPPLNGIILPGVTRQSLLDLARKWDEFRVTERPVTMEELQRALREGRVREIFGSGTACVVCPVHRILYQGESLHIPTMDNGPELARRFLKELLDIQVMLGAVVGNGATGDPPGTFYALGLGVGENCNSHKPLGQPVHGTQGPGPAQDLGVVLCLSPDSPFSLSLFLPVWPGGPRVDGESLTVTGLPPPQPLTSGFPALGSFPSSPALPSPPLPLPILFSLASHQGLKCNMDIQAGKLGLSGFPLAGRCREEEEDSLSILCPSFFPFSSMPLSSQPPPAISLQSHRDWDPDI